MQESMSLGQLYARDASLFWGCVRVALILGSGSFFFCYSLHRVSRWLLHILGLCLICMDAYLVLLYGIGLVVFFFSCIVCFFAGVSAELSNLPKNRAAGESQFFWLNFVAANLAIFAVELSEIYFGRDYSQVFGDTSYQPYLLMFAAQILSPTVFLLKPKPKLAQELNP